MVESGDVIAELFRHVDHGRHFIGAIAVLVNQDVAAQDSGERIETQIALDRLGILLTRCQLAFVLRLIADVFLCLDPLRTIPGDIAHACRRKFLVAAVDALRILATSHFQSLWRAGKFHSLVGHRGNVLQHDRAAADEIRGTGQYLHGRDAADARSGKSRVLRPDRMLGPDIGRDRAGRFVAIAVAAHLRARIHAEV